MVGCTVLCTLSRATARVAARAPAPRHLAASAPLRRAAPARATRRAFTTTVVAQGLQKNVVQEGSGPSPTPGDKVSSRANFLRRSLVAGIATVDSHSPLACSSDAYLPPACLLQVTVHYTGETGAGSARAEAAGCCGTARFSVHSSCTACMQASTNCLQHRPGLLSAWHIPAWPGLPRSCRHLP